MCRWWFVSFSVNGLSRTACVRALSSPADTAATVSCITRALRTPPSATTRPALPCAPRRDRTGASRADLRPGIVARDESVLRVRAGTTEALPGYAAEVLSYSGTTVRRWRTSARRRARPCVPAFLRPYPSCPAIAATSLARYFACAIQRFVASSTASTLAVSALSLISALPVSRALSRP